MTRRRKNSTFEELILVASRLPWWLCLALATVAWFGLHALATRHVDPPGQPTDLSRIMIEQMIRGGALFGQYIVPLLLVAGATVSAVNRRQSRRLLDSVAESRTTNPVQDLTWQQFEQLTGEAFRRRGFQVAENTAPGADGGIDLVLHKNGEKYLVQCKQWRAYKVGVGVVRELYGVMAAEGAVGGFVVTSGRFTKEAGDFAQGRNVELVDGNVLQQWIQATRKVDQANSAGTPTEHEHEHEKTAGKQMERVTICPRCQAPMVRRTAKRGRNAGKLFWGCSRYPTCQGTR